MIVIFSGYNQRAVVAFLRCLEKNHIRNYLIIAASNQDTILKTTYRDKVFCVRKNKVLDKNEIFEILGNIRRKYKEESLLISPSTEALNRFLLKYREMLEEQQCIIPLVDEKLYEMISDKENFWEFCKRNELLVPSNITLGECFAQPYVAKPKHYQAKDGKVYSPILVLTPKNHENFLKNYDADNFTYQKYITGDSYYILYYFARDGQVYSFSQQNYAQQPNGKSILVAVASDIHEKKLHRNIKKFFKSSIFMGLLWLN